MMVPEQGARATETPCRNSFSKARQVKIHPEVQVRPRGRGNRDPPTGHPQDAPQRVDGEVRAGKDSF